MDDTQELFRLLERKDLLDEIPDLPQRQDSTASQLEDLIAVANKLGMYDAADLLNQTFNE